MQQINVLISGFGPYEGVSVNPSYEVPKALAEHGLPRPEPAADTGYGDDYEEGVSITAVTLPVSFAKAWPTLLEAIDAVHPHIVIATGLKSSARGVMLERCATNLMDTSRPDADNAQPRRTAIEEQGPAAYWTRLPLRAILKAFTDDGICATLSSDAGTFVCNSLFYRLLHWSAAQEHVLSGFISVPKVAGSGSRELGLPLGQQIKAVGDVVQETIAYYQHAPASGMLIA